MNTTQNSSWKVEKLNDYVYRLYSDTYQTTNILFGEIDMDISECYISLPNTISEDESNKVLSEINIDVGGFITTASLSIEYMKRLDYLRESASKIIITQVRRDYYHSEYEKLYKEFSDKLRSVSHMSSLIAPYKWSLIPVYDKNTFNGVDISINRGQRVFVLQMI